ncbi:MAG: hypothetical protein PF441_01685 [Desulfuromusa sp.]|jgi:translocation and assembly module TamB|nr:hypothetical protein [Desulfuromusa sp.]
MKKLIYRMALILLLAIVLFAGICWLYADQILDQFVRPQVEKIATQLFEAQVQIRQLVWTETGLEFLDLSVNVPQQVLVVVPRIELNFTPRSLWYRQLDALRITQPHVEIVQSRNQSKPAKTTLRMPDQLPLTIKHLTVSNGQLLIHSADRQWNLHDLNFSGSLQQNCDFILSAFFGPDENHPVAITGTAELSQQQTLTIKSLSWQAHQLLTAPLQINLAGSDLTLGHSILHLDQFNHIMLRSLLTALGQPSLLPEEVAFSLTDASITFALKNQAIDLEVQVKKGQIGWNDLSGNFSQLKLLLNQEQQGWRVAGQLQGPAKSTFNFSTQLDDNNNLTGQVLVDVPDPDDFKTQLIGDQALQITGALQLAAKYSLQEDRFQLTIDIQGLTVKNPDNDYLLDIGKLNGQSKLLIIDRKEKFSLNLQLASRPFLSVDGNFQQLNFSLTASDLQDFTKLLAPGKIPRQIQSATGLMVAGNLSRKAAGWAGNFQLTVDDIGLPDLTLKEVVSRGKLHLSSDQVSFEETSIHFTLARGDELSAQMNVRGTGEFSPKKFSLDLQQLSLTHLNYMAPDGQTGVGEAVIDLQGNIGGSWLEGPMGLELNGTFAAQEVLAGKFYADLSAFQGDFLLSGNFAPDTRKLTASSVKINLPQLGFLTAKGQFSPEHFSTQGHIEVADLAESYGEQIGPLLSEFKPALAGLTLEGGMSLDYNLRWDSDVWQTNGALRLREVDAYWDRQQLEIIGGNGTIPFAISSGQGLSESGLRTEYAGEMSFETLSAGLATLEQGCLELTAARNRFSFLSPILLQLAGGQVKIENLTLKWPTGKPQGSAKINIAQVDLETLTQKLGLPVMQGRLNANLGTLRYANRQLSTDGLANVEVFGGRFQLRNMRYSDPFSSYPTFHTDIDFSGLDLLQATRTFDFGEMNGLLDGHIYGLQLFGSTPAAFDAAIATRAKGKRNISVKALNNLSIISQGGMSAALSRGIYRFIDFYRYQKIGFKCSLNNDTFTLLGTALSGSDRYLVHGGLLPPRIDITTTTPTISFKEMMNRLGRIDRAGN